MLLQDSRIVILGGGPAGLTAARLLHKRGLSPLVLERDASPSARSQGGSLDLHEGKGLRAIEEIGLIKEFEAVARPQGARYSVLDENAKVYVQLTDADMGASRPEIDRTQLRAMLLNSLPPTSIKWGVNVTAIVPSPKGGYAIQTSGSGTIEADLVLACDGMNSKARALVTAEKPQYAGVSFVQATVTKPDEKTFFAETLGPGSLFALGNDQAILGQRNGDDSMRVYYSLRVPEDTSKSRGADLTDAAAVRAMLQNEFKRWDPRLMAVLDEADHFAWWPLYSVAAEQKWNNTHKGLTLLGDAAHVMPPFTGEGVNLAMLDAMELVYQLFKHDNVETAIAEYESGMLARMKEAIVDVQDNQDRIMSPHGPVPLLKMFGVTV